MPRPGPRIVFSKLGLNSFDMQLRKIRTLEENPDRVACANCGKTIALFKEEAMEPSFEECYAKGNVPVPNLGWFCSQPCAIEFEQAHDVTFARTNDGMIDYYRNEWGG